MSTSQAFRPEDHFRNLKGQQYLEMKWRVVWFRDEHPEGYIKTEIVKHDEEAGLAIFRAQAGYMSASGVEVYATGYGSETRRDFADFLEKSETKSVGRALALLGYGTQFAIELEEDEHDVVDSPVERSTKPRSTLAVVPAPVDVEALRAEVTQRLAADPEAAGKLPKGPETMNGDELSKTLAWMTRRARAHIS